MWHDNETEIDLINVEHLKWAVSQTIQNPEMLPVTIGVFGDWGSGKTSLLRLVQNELQGKDDRLCLWFNGWLFEGYEDAKAALLGTIIEEIQKKRTLSEKAQKLVKRLLRRIDWFSVMGLVGHGAVSFALGLPGLEHIAAAPIIQSAAQALPNILRPDEKTNNEQPSSSTIRSEIRQFREDFAELLGETKVKTLVVFIDDLDRCLPETIVSTLEALRLFLSVPNTAFIIAADENLVELAVQTRYGKESSGIRNIARDYLEKLVQVPVRIPSLSHLDVITYVNLLFVQLHFGKRVTDVTKKLSEDAKVDPFGNTGFDFPWLKENFKDVPNALEDDFALAMQVGNLLAEHLRGNPRQIKRFLNTLMLRLGMSEQRGAQLERRVLAKLMILEYASRTKFKKLADLQASQHGKPRELESLELRAAQPTKAEQKTSEPQKAKVKDERSPELDAELEEWLNDEWLMSWLTAEPGLSGIDLRPYFYISRETIGLTGLGRLRMLSKSRTVFELLTSGSEVKVKQALSQFRVLPIQEATEIAEVLCQRARESERHGGSVSLAAVLISIAEVRPEFSRHAITTLRGLPDATLSAGIPLLLAGLKKSATDLSGEIDQVLTSWSKSAANKSLAGAARSALEKKF